MKKTFLLMALAALSTAALAKLPAPVLDDAAKAKAEEAKAKTAHTGKVDAYKLCLSMDKAAAHYQKTAAAGKAVKPATATPPCADPGPFVWPAPATAAAAPAAPAAPAAAAAPAAPAAAAPAKKS